MPRSRPFGWIAAAILVCSIGCASAPAPDATFSFAATRSSADSADDKVSSGHAVLMWLPNRVFDVLDVVRLRLRLGPGLGAGARVTEVADITLGGWSSVFVGIPGPRGRPVINWPIGLETYAGAELSVLDASTEDDEHAPNYGPAEVGLGLHLLILGLEVGVEPWEAVDFIVGLAFFDPVGDDL